jgi:hypothetical protein
MFRTTLLWLSGAAVVGSTGLAHGLRTGRWQVSDAREQAVAALERVPLGFGDWEGEAVAADARAFERVGADGFLVRRYRNRVTGDSVSVMLVCGLPGPVAVHSPDVCYPSTGYELVAPPEHVAVPADSGEAGEFFSASFRKRGGVEPGRLRVLWAWHSPGGGWSAPENPRWAFARSAALFKLYVIRETASSGERPGDDPDAAFLGQFLPRLEKL